MTEELELVEKIRSSGMYDDEYELSPDSAAALIRAYGDRRVSAAADDYFEMPLYSHYAAKRLARWRDLCLDKIAFYEHSLKPMVKINQDQEARIAELENQLFELQEE